MINGSFPRTGHQGAFLGPNDYSYIDLSSNTGVDDTYVNPIVGLSDFGPFPANMTRRNIFRQPGVWNGLDLGVFKDFKFTERFNLQLRAESFNVFNHSNLYVQIYDNFSPFVVVDAKRGASASNVALKGAPKGSPDFLHSSLCECRFARQGVC